MCEGWEWELLLQEHAREFARRKYERAEVASHNAPATAPPKPAEAPRTSEEPIPV